MHALQTGCFRTPPSTLLGSIECWGRVEVQSDSFFVAQEDVKDFFYRLGFSKGLDEYFSLPEVDAVILHREMGKLPLEAANLVERGVKMYPYLKVFLGLSSSS